MDCTCTTCTTPGEENAAHRMKNRYISVLYTIYVRLLRVPAAKKILREHSKRGLYDAPELQHQ